MGKAAAGWKAGLLPNPSGLSAEEMAPFHEGQLERRGHATCNFVESQQKNSFLGLSWYWKANGNLRVVYC